MNIMVLENEITCWNRRGFNHTLSRYYWIKVSYTKMGCIKFILFKQRIPNMYSGKGSCTVENIDDYNVCSTCGKSIMKHPDSYFVFREDLNDSWRENWRCYCLEHIINYQEGYNGNNFLTKSESESMMQRYEKCYNKIIEECSEENITLVYETILKNQGISRGMLNRRSFHFGKKKLDKILETLIEGKRIRDDLVECNNNKIKRIYFTEE